MKTLMTIPCFLFFGVFLAAQVNLELLSRFPINDRLNDIWGYAAPDGREYALTCGSDGVYVLDVSDPLDPVLVYSVIDTLANYRWFDIKTWNDRAYIVADPGSASMMIMNLALLPDTVTYHFWDNADGPGPLFTEAHNCWIDEFGYGYLAGSSLSGGIAFLDLFTDPDLPKFIGEIEVGSAHDIFTKGNVLYAAGGFSSDLNIYDVSDKSAPAIISSVPLSAGHAHSSWVSGDGKTLFTSEEIPYAPISSFDIFDLQDVQLLDEFRVPVRHDISSIPHNVYEKNGYLIISHYVDGVLIVDANRPDNLIQVGQYDTSNGCSGFSGAFGVYPYLPSGNIIVSDREQGVFVLKPTYQRASYLTGKIINKKNGNPIFGAAVKINSTEHYEVLSDLAGNFKTGQSSPGNFELLVNKGGFFNKKINIDLQSGATNEITVELEEITFPEKIRVTEKNNERPIVDATVAIELLDTVFYLKTNIDGEVNWPLELVGNYTIHAGKWGWQPASTTPYFIPNSKLIAIELERGYADNFVMDFGWEIVSDATMGEWERGIPNDVPSRPCRPLAPPDDDRRDAGNSCYVTGNEPIEFNPNGNALGYYFNQDLDGTTVLASPKMALKSTYLDPLLSYSTWFVNSDFLLINNLTGIIMRSSEEPLNDTMFVYLDNGMEKVLIEKITSAHSWTSSPNFKINDIIEITDEVQLIVEVVDFPETAHFTEAAFDDFRIEEGGKEGDLPFKNSFLELNIFPNPFPDNFNLKYSSKVDVDNLELIVFNLFGQIIEKRTLVYEKGNIELGSEWANGIYFLVFNDGSETTDAIKIIKAK